MSDEKKPRPEQEPEEETAQESEQDAATAEEGLGGTEDAAASADDSSEDKEELREMSFLDHLDELRLRLTRCIIAVGVGFLACYGFSKQLFDILVAPLVAAMPPESKLIYTAMPEAFFTYIKVAIVAGILLSSPYIFYQIWLFVAPGLYKEERKWLLPIGFVSGLFFTGGALFGYMIVFPFAFDFFMGFHTELIQPMPSLKEYLSFSLKLLFAFGVVFELPLFIFFLARLGVVTAQSLRKFRKYAILLGFIVSALLTPPDVISQCLMAGPLIILWELSIIVALVFGRKPKEKPTDEDEESVEEDETEGGEPKTEEPEDAEADAEKPGEKEESPGP